MNQKIQNNNLNKLILILKTVALSAVFFACQVPKKESLAQIRQNNFDTAIYPKLQTKLQHCDLIFRLGTDMTSELFRRLNTRDTKYSHVGMVSMEDGAWWVYHAIGGEFNPDQKMKRESLESFTKPIDCKRVGIYRPILSAQQQIKTIRVLKGWYAMEIPFDMDFDWYSNDKLYCAELIAKLLLIGFKTDEWLNYTQKGVIKYIAIDNLYGFEQMQKIEIFEY